MNATAVMRQRIKTMQNIIHQAPQKITCPKCESHQDATAVLREGAPFWDRVHTCGQCEYVIMESEWEPVDTAPAND